MPSSKKKSLRKKIKSSPKTIKRDFFKKSSLKTSSDKSNKKEEDSLKQKKSKLKSKLANKKVLVASLIVLIFFALVFVLLWGIYEKNWAENEKWGKYLTWLPLPSVKVNAQLIPLKEFYEDLNSLKIYNQQQKSNFDFLPQLSETNLKEMALTKLIRESFLKQEAQRMGITISSQEIEQELEKLIQDSGGREALERTSQTLYGWTLDDVRKKLIYPFVLRKKIQAKIKSDHNLNKSAFEKASKLQKLIKEGKTSFSDLITQYSEIPQASPNDTFFVSQSDNWDPKFLEAVFKLSEGEVSGLISGEDGFYFIKLEKIIPATKEKEEVREIRYIFIAHKTVEEWFLENQNRLKIKFFLPGFEWNKEEGRVVFKG